MNDVVGYVLGEVLRENSKTFVKALSISHHSP